MNPGLWGAVCAVNLGCADFMARFTTRGVGAPNLLLAVMSVGAVILSGWIWLTGPVLVWDISGLWLVIVNGGATAIMTLLLYQGRSASSRPSSPATRPSSSCSGSRWAAAPTPCNGPRWA
jgi:hypothetical protein